MSKTPPTPKEQRSFAGKDGAHDRRDERTGTQSPDPGDADVNLQSQGRFGNAKQNLTPQRHSGDR